MDENKEEVNLGEVFKNIVKIPICFERFQFLNCVSEEAYEVLLNYLYSYGVDHPSLYEEDIINWCVIEVSENTYIDLLTQLGYSDKSILATPLHCSFVRFEDREGLLVITVKNMQWSDATVVRKKKSIKVLELELKEAIKKEEYEKASKLQKQIEYKKNNKKQDKSN